MESVEVMLGETAMIGDKMTNVVFYKVGGCVRDSLLGVQSKDIDYAVEADSYNDMRDAIIKRGGKIYVEHPEYLTIRAKVNNEDADFVLCRKDGEYTDGRRPDSVEPGTILDDLARRDFTINAMAEREDGEFIDPHDGAYDLELRTLRTVGNPYSRFNEDGLRILRALRFMVTKNLMPSHDLSRALMNPDTAKLLDGVSSERIKDELMKALRHNQYATLRLLMQTYVDVGRVVLKHDILWLKPTLEKR